MNKPTKPDIQCDPKGASPAFNKQLQEHNRAPQAIEDCDEAPRAFPDRDPAKKKTGEF